MSSVRISTDDEYSNRPPKGAKIVKHSTNTTIEKIKNGYIITKNHSGRYQTGNKNLKEDYNYFDYTEKVFSEENPVQIKLPDDTTFEEDSDLAKAFPEPKEKD